MKKSRKSKDRINNLIIFIVLIALLWSLYSFLKNDIESLQEHLTKCRQVCYPDQVVEALSNRYCVCQEVPKETIEDEKGTKEWQTLNPDNSI